MFTPVPRSSRRSRSSGKSRGLGGAGRAAVRQGQASAGRVLREQRGGFIYFFHSDLIILHSKVELVLFYKEIFTVGFYFFPLLGDYG